jgi:hypothetical protein
MGKQDQKGKSKRNVVVCCKIIYKKSTIQQVGVYFLNETFFANLLKK